MRLLWPVEGGQSLYPIGPIENGINQGTTPAHLARGEGPAIDIPARNVNLVAVHNGVITRAVFANDP